MLQLLVDTGEDYQRANECDRELFQVIALDAKGIHHTRMTARQAAKLLTDAASATEERPNASSTARLDSPQAPATAH